MQAIQYRFFADGLAHGDRYAQWPSGERLLHGQTRSPSARQMLANASQRL